MAQAAAAQVQDPQTEILDEPNAGEQSYRSGSVSEGELELSRTVAKRLGWTPKEDWTRDPAKWRDAPEFLEDTPRQIETLKERLKRTGQVTSDLLEEERRKARIEAQAELRQAAEAGNADAASAAAEKLARVSGPPPETVAWIGRNAWFNDDPDAQVLAVSEINRLAAQGASIPDQLSAAEAKVRKRFPEHFEVREQPREEVRLSEVRRNPPSVSAGSRGGVVVPKEKGFTDIPAGDRQQYEKHFAKRFVNQGLTAEQAQTKYARSYWANKGE